MGTESLPVALLYGASLAVAVVVVGALVTTLQYPAFDTPWLLLAAGGVLLGGTYAGSLYALDLEGTLYSS